MKQQGLFTSGDGCRLAWHLEGPDNAAVVMLSNSLGTDHRMWDPQFSLLRERYRVLRYDTRGHGASEAPGGAFSMDRLGRDVIELLDELQLERVHFCGLSMGGMTGQWLGVHAPERLSSLILCNTSAYMGPASSWQQRIDRIRSQGMAAVADAVVSRWFTPGFQQHDPQAVARIKAMLLATDPQGYTACCAAIRDMDQRPTASLIRTRTLVIAGDEDTATPPADSEALVAAIPQARLHRLSAAHLSNIEQAAGFSHALLDFLSG